jgi:protein-tyrosine phosphatase
MIETVKMIERNLQSFVPRSARSLLGALLNHWFARILSGLSTDRPGRRKGDILNFVKIGWTGGPSADIAWWIDEPMVTGRGDPWDEDLGLLRAKGFSFAVSSLEENKQPPRYDKKSAVDAGWFIYSIPFQENRAPSLDQIRDFTAQLNALPEGTKVLVFCESGKGRTACMGAAYRITKGLTASAAVARVSGACSDKRWATPGRQRVLGVTLQGSERF